MSYITVFLKGENYISVSNNNLYLKDKETKKEIKINLDDLDTLIVDNYKTIFSISAMNKLVEKNVNVILTDEKHVPNLYLLPFNSNSIPGKNINYQLDLNDRQKGIFWQKITSQKIINQRNLIKYLNGENEDIEKINILLKTKLVQGDKKNVEAQVARIFFRNIYGSEFIRFKDDAINSGLNYGYKILTAKVMSSLISYGLHPMFGIFHHNKTNYFNLAYDFVEPFRPIVDFYVDQLREILLSVGLNVFARIQISRLLDEFVLINGKNMRIKDAINYMVKSFVSSIQNDECDIFTPTLYYDVDLKLEFEEIDEEIIGDEITI